MTARRHVARMVGTTECLTASSLESNDPEPVLGGFRLLAELSAGGDIWPGSLEFTHSIDGMASTVLARGVDTRDETAGAVRHRDVRPSDLDAVAQDLPHGNTAAMVRYDGAAMAQVLDLWRAAGWR